jgi:hypothetical protein
VTSTQHHIIRRQILEIDVAGTEADGLALQRRLPGLCQDWLTPALEDVLDRTVPGDEHWTIDRLDIDAGSFRPEDLERGLADAVAQAIEQHLRERAPRAGSTGLSSPAERRRQAQLATQAMQDRFRDRTPPGSMSPPGAIERRTQAQSLQEAFVHFLETGVLPWWSYLPHGKTLEDLIRDTWQAGKHADGRPEHFARALADAIGPASVRKRLVRQFSADFLDTLLAGVSQEGAAAVREILAELGKHDIAAQTLNSFFEHLWEAAFATAFRGEPPVAETLIAESLSAMSSDAERQYPSLVERIAELWPGAKARDSGLKEEALRESDVPDRAHKAPPKSPAHRKDFDERASRIDLEEEVYVGWASIVREILAELGKHDIAAQTLSRFSQDLWETAFAMAIAGERPVADVLIAESLNAMSSDAEGQHRLLVERIAQLWPAAKGRDSRLEEKALQESDAPDRTYKAASKPPLDRKELDEPASRIELEEGVYVSCAGVALLHPFLPRLFEALGIAKDDKLRQPERALSLLHFLATGQRFAPEYDLLLPKLLCNVPFDAPVESRIDLTTAEEEEAAALLAAVIRHWDALGDTSIDGLRGSFLVRPGKLSRRGSEDVLQVEARSYDILLDRLPWGIGLIQLPWMRKMLWVEWRF